MKLLRQNAGSFKEDLQLETAAAKLIFVVNTTNSTLDETAFNKMTVSITLVTPNRGERVVLPKMSLRDAFGISAQKEGFFVWGTKQIKGYIDLSRNGAVALADGSYFSINYDGFPQDASTDIMTIDYPVLAADFEHIEEISINGTAKDLNVRECTDLYIPVTDADGNGIDVVQIDFDNRTVTYSEEELKVYNDSTNDLTCVIAEELKDTLTGSLIKFGYDRLLHVDVRFAKAIRLTPKTRVPVVVYTAMQVAI